MNFLSGIAAAGIMQIATAYTLNDFQSNLFWNGPLKVTFEYF